ncbi:MAG: hypothetical protein HKO66_09395 [Saprospiraceae bacterium]|nr:hypothetical protein [Bacteroidia bacterium]NNL92432.1 hypothetical protein [Saprospiraceae bacterium]
MKNKITTFCAIILLSFSLNGQEEKRQNFIAIGANYGLNQSFSDLSDRFGTHFQAGISLDLFKEKINTIFSIEGAILFGDHVKEDVLANLRLENGSILGSDGGLVDVFLRQRGTYLGLMGNKIVLKSQKNPYSGLALGLGFGVLQHNIRIQVDTNNAPQFNGNYGKGYDRNTMGFALKQQIGLMSLSKNKRINFELALNLTEGFTKNTRAINFDTGLKDDKSRIDIIIGLDFKWMIPLKSQYDKDEEIFY